MNVTSSGRSAAVDKDAVKGHVEKNLMTKLWNIVGACGDNIHTIGLYKGSFDYAKTPLATTTIDSNGDFKLSGLGALGVKLDGSQFYTLSHTNCEKYYARVVTNNTKQDLTPASTLLAYAISDDGKPAANASSSLTSLESVEAELASASSSEAAYKMLKVSTKSPNFNKLFNLAVEDLKVVPPKILELNMPTTSKERVATKFSVSAVHWDPDYSVAYQWKIDDVKKSTSANFTYTPNANSQGLHTMKLVVGTKNSSGDFDSTKSSRTIAISHKIDDTISATPVTMSLANAIQGGGELWTTTRNIVINLATGSNLKNCESFSHLALTEDDASAPLNVDDYTVTCTADETQPLSYQLKSSSDGAKTLRLWAIDATGTISSTSSTLVVNLDTTAPDAPTITGPTILIGSSTPTATWTAAAGDKTYTVLVGSTSGCASPLQTFSSVTATSQVLSSLSDGTYYLCLSAQDWVANSTAATNTNYSFIVDATAPTAGTFSASSSVTATSFTLNWAAATDAATATTDLQYLVCSGSSASAINSVAKCEAATQEMAYSANTLTTDISGKTFSTNYYYNVVVKDTAGNKSIYDGKTQATTADTTPPTASTFSASSGVTTSGFTLNWGVGSDDLTTAASLRYLVCSGANAAAIDTVAECEAATEEMAYTTNVLTLAITGKTAATTYHYNVVVKDAAGNKSIYDGKSQSTASDTTPPTVGAFTTSTSIGATAFTLHWTAGTDDVTAAANLQYLVCSGANAAAIDTIAKCEAATQEMSYTANALSLAITGKSVSTTYYYNVILKDAADNKALYSGKSQATTADTTAPTAGTFAASTSVGATTFTLNWSAASDDVTAASSLQYFVCSGSSASNIDTVAKCEAATSEMSYTANTLTLGITGKTVSTTYFYNVVVKDAAGNKSLYDGKSQATIGDAVAPTAGSFSASTGVDATAFTLNWSVGSDNVTSAANLQYLVCSDSSAANIDTVAKCETATTEMAYTANTLTKAVTGKSVNTTYYYNVVVKDAAGNKSLYDGKAQATTADTTAPTAGTFSASTSVGATSFTLNWSAASDDVTTGANLQYFVCSGAAAANIDTVAECESATAEMAYTANTLTKAVSGKTVSTTFYYNVIVQDAAGNKTLYNGKSQATTADTTVPIAGTFSASTSVGAVGFTLNWSAATDDATAAASLQYLVCSGAAASDIDTVAECEAATSEMAYSANTLTKAITGKAVNTTFYFNVVVKDAAGNKSIYDGKTQATTTDSTAPTAGGFTLSTGIGATSFTLNWTAASDNATSAASLQYFLCSGAIDTDIDTVAKCEAATTEMAYTANTLTKAITGKSVNVTYYYNVVVKDAAGNKSLYSGKTQATSSDTTDPTAGTFSASTGVGPVGFTLNWSAATDDITAASSLQYMVCSGANAAAIDTVAECEAATTEMSYTANTLTTAITGKSVSTTYYYNVVVQDAAGNKSIYNGKTQATTTDTTAPTAGSFSASTSVGPTGFILNWSAASDDATAAASLQYFVCSGANAAAIDTVAECEAATTEMAYTANTLTKTITGKSVSTTYYYNVVVKDAAGNKSLYDGKAQTTNADTTVPTAGTFSASTSVGATGFTLNWSAASDDVTAAGSLLYFVCSGASTGSIDTVAKCEAATSEMAYTANTLTLAISGKTVSTTYYYNVVVKDASGNKSLYNGKSQATTADTTVPTAGSFSASTGVGATAFTLNWSAATDDVTAGSSLQYFVCSGASAAAIDTVAECEAATAEMAYTANTLTKSFTGKTVSTTYYYNVVVKDAASNKSLYNGKTQATTADTTVPTAGTFSSSTSVGALGFTLNWSAASDDVTAASSLQYFVCSGANAAAIDTVAECEAATSEMAYTANTLTKAITGKSVSTTYYYNVVVKDAAGNKSIYDGKAQATTADTTVPTAGTFSASTSVTATSFTLNWSAATDDVTAAASLQYLVCSGANAASIDTVAECEAATSEMAYTANTLTFAISGKSVSTTYYYNVVVKDSASNKSIYNGKSQATTADTTTPTAGSFSASTGVGAVAFTLNWSAATDDATAAGSLQYFVCSGANAAAIDTVAECEAATVEMAYSTNTLTKAITGKSVSTTYYYNVVVKDAASNKSIYNGKTQATTADITVPTAGTFSASSSVNATSFSLNWSAASDDATAAASLQYFVCSGANAAAIDTVAECEAATSEMAYTANTVTKSITGKAVSTTYYYNVVVKDAAGNKSLYDGKTQATTADTTPPTAGTFSASTSVNATSFTLNWSAASDDATAAASLQYFVCSGANAAAIDTVAECEAETSEMAYAANTLTKAISGRSVSTTYYYNVVVKDASGNKSIYNGKSQATTADTTAPSAGTFSASTSVNATSFTLNWSAATNDVTAGASLQYFVCSGANAAAIDTVAECEAATSEMAYAANTLTLAVSGKAVSTTYYYNVVVKDAAGNKSIYNGKSQATTADTTAPTAGTFSASTSVGATGFTLNWSVASDDATAAASLQYFVCSGANAAAVDTVAECEAATSEMAYTAITLTKVISGKSVSTTYYYNVVVKDAAGNKSIYDGKTQATTADTTAPSAGTFSSSTGVGATAFTLNWSAASDNVTAAASLQYFVCSGANAAAIDTVAECEAATPEMAYAANTLTLSITGKTVSTTYYYNVVVKDAAGNKSIYNGLTQASTADTTVPTAGAFSSSSSITGTSFTLAWTAATDDVTAAASLQYFVCSGANAAAIDTVAECEAATSEMAFAANTLTKAISGKSVSTTYYYNVVVKDAAGNKSIYNGKSQATASLPLNAAAGVTFTDTDLDANQVAGTVVITKASSESDVTDYVLYWGSNSTTKQNATPIATIAATGSDLYQSISLNTAIPTSATATHFLVFSKNVAGEMATGVSIALNDNATANTWTATTTTSAPSARGGSPGVVWTGSKMIVWGGNDGTSSVNTGGVYDPVASSWTATTTTSAPTAVTEPSAIWTGSKMIVWGGNTYSIYGTNTGGLYDPVTNAWTATTSTSAPADRYSHTAIWTGSKMIIFGGYTGIASSTGGVYDPVANSWTATTSTNAPGGRFAHTAVWTGSKMIVWGGSSSISYTEINTGGIYDPAANSWTATTSTSVPAARFEHVSVWTGSKMIVWGGTDNTTELSSGGLYDPIANSWTATTSTNVPSARAAHLSAVWTGSDMIIWGGQNGGTAQNTGSIYNPAANTWTTVTTTSAPSARDHHAAVWTGSKMIIWGGANGATEYNTGGIYTPPQVSTANTWSATTTTSAPTARTTLATVWTGSKMIVWGGNDGTSSVNTGGLYDPVANSWSATTTTSAPAARYDHSAIWTGSKMIVWGGRGSGTTGLDSGGLYDPVANSWSATTTTSAPSIRYTHTTVWTGSKMIVWGGKNSATDGYDSGGVYDPVANSWTATTTTNAPSARRDSTAIWTGSKMIVWGGHGTGSTAVNTGGLYDPVANSWTATTSTSAPVERYLHTAVWTGSKMIVWGGDDINGTALNSGGIYDAAANSWTAITTTGAPPARQGHTSVWTGFKVVIWGGKDTTAFNSGGLYDPVANSWALSTTTSAPTARVDHTAIWTGSKMIIFGGDDGTGTLNNDGGLYIP